MSIATTTTNTLCELDTNATALQANAKSLRDSARRLTQHGTMALICFAMWGYVARTHRRLARLNNLLVNVEVESPEDRECLREVASSLATTAEALFEAHRRMGQDRPSMHVWPFGSMLMSSLESLAIKIEDMSETAALGASQEFANAVDQQLSELGLQSATRARG